MSAPCRVLRFRTAGSDATPWPGGRRLIDVHLDASQTPAGHIVRLEAGAGVPARWAYVLPDGRATGLQSTCSRQDLEAAIREYYFQELVADRLRSA